MLKFGYHRSITLSFFGVIGTLKGPARALVPIVTTSSMGSLLQEESIRIVCLSQVSDEALALIHEYYEAIQVVVRDTREGLQAYLAHPHSGIWLAYLNNEAVGCVVLCALASIPHAAECKRLYVRPAARGRQIADRLLDAMEEFARRRDIQWIYLDSKDDLPGAIALYRRRGYEFCPRYNDNPQATVFLRKELELVQDLDRV